MAPPFSPSPADLAPGTTRELGTTAMVETMAMVETTARGIITDFTAAATTGTAVTVGPGMLSIGAGTVGGRTTTTTAMPRTATFTAPIYDSGAIPLCL